MLVPAFTLAGPCLRIPRLACAAAVVLAVDELFAVDGSGTGLETVAVFAMVPDAEVAVDADRLTVAVPPGASVPIEQLTVLVPEQLPCVEFADTKLNPLGSTSVTVTVVASLGPLLVTRME